MLIYGIVLCGSLAICYLFGERHRRLCAFSIGIFMAIMAFNMDVHPSSDLNRYYYYLDFFREMTWSECWLFSIVSNNPIHYISLLLCSRLPNNQLYTAIITFIDYFLIIKLIGNVCDDRALNKRYYLSSILFVLLNLNFFLVSNVIRIFLVFVVFFYCLYEESVRKRHKVICWIVYVVLVFYHYAMILLVVARIFAAFMKSTLTRRGFAYKIFIVLLAIAGCIILFRTSLGGYITDKIIDYSDYSVRGTWQTIMGTIQFIMVGTMLFFAPNDLELGIKSYKLTIVALFIINLLSLNNYQMILRFGNAMVISSPVLHMYLYKSNDNCNALNRLRIFEFVNCVGTLIVFTYTMVYYYHTFL